jgi:hypothetical protein
MTGGYPCCCPAVDCDFCTNGWPASWSVDIASVTSKVCGTGPPTNCTDFNQSYVVDGITVTDASFCRTCSNLGVICFNSDIIVKILKSGSDYILRGVVSSSCLDVVTYLRWEKNLGTSKPDCTSFSGEVLTFASSSGHACAAEAASSTFTVTAN